MKVKVAEASDIVLDWLVAKCEELDTKLSSTGFLIYSDKTIPTGPQGRVYQPSPVWAQGGPIIERKKISISFTVSKGVAARTTAYPPEYHYGSTALEAAMRCYTVSKLGPEIEVPDELLET